MPFPRRRAPWWFVVVVAAALACALRVLDHASGALAGAPGDGPRPLVAFWFFVVLLAGWIWKGFEVAGRVTLIALQWAVANLYLIVTKFGNGLLATGHALLVGLKRGWDLLRGVWDDVLKPAWAKFWKLFDKLRTWLTDTFGPVLDWLQAVRKYLVDFWATYVRPWLDLIDVTRRLLRVLASLGLTWARALDARLAKLEDEITKPFLFVLGKLNEVIGIVNSVITAGGLLQRVALIRSMARDYEFAWRAIANPYQAGYDRTKGGPVDDAIKPRTAAQISAAYVAWVTSRSGDRADMYAAAEAAVKRELAGA